MVGRRMRRPLLMCRHCEIAWIGEVLSRKNLEQLLIIPSQPKGRDPKWITPFHFAFDFDIGPLQKSYLPSRRFGRKSESWGTKVVRNKVGIHAKMMNIIVGPSILATGAPVTRAPR